VSTTWLVTREERDAAEACAALEARGRRAVSVPCLETAPEPWPWGPPSPGTVTLFTSRRAVEAWVRAGAAETGTLAALAPATVAALAEAGYVPALSATGGIVGLARALLADWEARGRPALALRHPTSDLGLGTAERRSADDVLAPVGPVDHRVVYRTRAPAGLAAALRPHVEGAWAVTFASPSAIDHLLAALPASATPPVAVECAGGSTLRRWNERRPSQWPPAVPQEHP
jgi:uroporphyrinogen-III synthase